MKKSISKPVLKTKNQISIAQEKENDLIAEWSKNYEIPGIKADEVLKDSLLSQGYGYVNVLPKVGYYFYQDHFNGSYEHKVLSKCVAIKGDCALFEVCDSRNLEKFPVDYKLPNNNVHFFQPSLDATQKRLYLVPLGIKTQTQIKKYLTPQQELQKKFHEWKAKILAERKAQIEEWKNNPSEVKLVEGALVWEGAQEGNFVEKQNLTSACVRQWDKMKANPKDFIEWDSVWNPNGKAKAKYYGEYQEIPKPDPSQFWLPIDNCAQYLEYKNLWDFTNSDHIKDFLKSIGYEVHHIKNLFVKGEGENQYTGCTFNYAEIHSFQDTWYTVRVFEEYRIFESYAQIFCTCKYETYEWKMTKPVLPGGGTSTSLESDGFWNK